MICMTDEEEEDWFDEVGIPSPFGKMCCNYWMHGQYMIISLYIICNTVSIILSNQNKPNTATVGNSEIQCIKTSAALPASSAFK